MTAFIDNYTSLNNGDFFLLYFPPYSDQKSSYLFQKITSNVIANISAGAFINIESYTGAAYRELEIIKLSSIDKLIIHHDLSKLINVEVYYCKAKDE